MKTSMILIGVLAFTTVSFAFDRPRAIKIAEYAKKCIEEMGTTPEAPGPVAAVCIARTDGKLLNANGEYIRDAIMKVLDDIISETNRLEKAKQLYNKCHDEAEEKQLTGNNQAMHIATCSIEVLQLFDKV